VEYGVPVLLVVAITVLCALLVKRFPVLLATWMAYLLALAPLLGFTQAGPQGMAARYTYFAGLPLSFLGGLGMIAVYGRSAASRSARGIVIAGAALLLLMFGSFTWRQIQFWKDDVTLWTRVIDLYPQTVGRAYYQRATAYFTRGEYVKALRDLDIAVTIAESKGYNRMYEIYLYRARTRRHLGDLVGAIADYSRALNSADSADRNTYYRERGELLLEQGKRGEAEEDFRRSSAALENGH
jgi:tetratricopeptide (TPR) repeat protein